LCFFANTAIAEWSEIWDFCRNDDYPCFVWIEFNDVNPARCSGEWWSVESGGLPDKKIIMLWPEPNQSDGHRWVRHISDGASRVLCSDGSLFSTDTGCDIAVTVGGVNSGLLVTATTTDSIVMYFYYSGEWTGECTGKQELQNQLPPPSNDCSISCGPASFFGFGGAVQVYFSFPNPLIHTNYPVDKRWFDSNDLYITLTHFAQMANNWTGDSAELCTLLEAYMQ